MRLFNALQIALIIVTGPLLIPLLRSAPFWGANALMWILIAVWVALFFWVVAMICDSLGHSK